MQKVSRCGIPDGQHLACCYLIADLGTQKGELGGDTRYRNEILMRFEVHGNNADGSSIVNRGGKLATIEKIYPLSLSSGSLKRDAEALLGVKDMVRNNFFKLKDLLGCWAIILVANSKIIKINPMPKPIRRNLPDPYRKIKFYVIDTHNKKIFESFSEEIKAKIMNAPEFQERSLRFSWFGDVEYR